MVHPSKLYDPWQKYTPHSPVRSLDMRSLYQILLDPCGHYRAGYVEQVLGS